METPVELPQGPAVYAIENLADGKLYIGSSVNAARRALAYLMPRRSGAVIAAPAGNLEKSFTFD